MDLDEIAEEEVSFGSSIIVPSVQELSKQPIIHVPPRYLRPDHHHHQPDTCLPSIPIIDFQKLHDHDSSELERLHSASTHWGFFQVINHGVSTSLVSKMKLEVENLFNLPYTEKKNLWQEPNNHQGFGQLFVVSEEQKLDWSDMFYITTLPHHLRKSSLFQKLPPTLRETLECYSMEVKKLAIGLLSFMGRVLKMDDEEIRELFSDGVQAMRMNYYPPCPQPDKVIGFTPHSDADALTILLQLNDTQGLQIRKEGQWIPVKPLPDAFIVNIGDIMEIVSNGVYRSIEHRATVNASKERLSIATFYSSKLESVLGPAKSLIGPNSPANFRSLPLEKYFKEFFARKLSGKAYIDFMKIDQQEPANNTSEKSLVSKPSNPPMKQQ